MQILALSGSLRQDSFNTRLARALSDLAPEDLTVQVATVHDIPLYDGDLEEAAGIPGPVEALRERIKAADGLVLVTPEYNAGLPGVLKNTLDWLTRPPTQIGPTFRDRPTALAGATPGGLGTALAQAGSLVVLRQLGVRLFPDHLRISSVDQRIDPGGQPDQKLAEQLRRWLDRFQQFVAG